MANAFLSQMKIIHAYVTKTSVDFIVKQVSLLNSANLMCDILCTITLALLVVNL